MQSNEQCQPYETLACRLKEQDETCMKIMQRQQTNLKAGQTLYVFFSDKQPSEIGKNIIEMIMPIQMIGC